MGIGLTDNVIKLSPMQTSLLFHSLISQETIYVQQLICRLNFKMDLACFRSAWQQVFDRHEILRIAFRWKDLGEPVQDIYPHVLAAINEVDLRSFPTEQQAVRVDGYLRHDRKTQFDFSTPPLVRLTVLHLGDHESLFLFTHHHAALDGRSRKILITEAFLVYNALCSGETIALPPAAQFREFIGWLNLQDWDDGKDYWRNLFMAGDHCELMDNLTCGNAAQKSIYASANWPEVTVDGASRDRLESLARDNGFTLNTILQACWVILLHRYSGESAVTFGATRACRHLPIAGIAGMAGLLINTVPLRACFALETRVIDVLKALRTQSIDAGPCESTPLAKIQEFSGIEAGRPLFETIVVFEQHDLNYMPELEGRRYVPADMRRYSNDPYPLSLFALGRPSFCFEVGYDPLRFDKVFIGRLVRHYLALLQEVPATLTARVSDLRLLRDSESRHLITELNQTEIHYPAACVHELFEAQALKTPSAIAIDYCGTELTYQELQTRANQLARYLADCGVKAERLVGIYMDRCPQMIIAILGILKAGGAYVPLDPAYPADRLNFMIGDAGLELLLAKKSQGPPGADVRIINLEAEWDRIARARGQAVQSYVMPENLTYIIYTSGSTGRPKGVSVEHRQVCNQLFWAGNALSLGPADRVLQKASFSFDASILEIFLPLSCGARIVMAEPDGEQDVDYLLRLVIERRVTYSDMVPSHLDALLNHPSISQWKSLRVLTCGAEVLQPELVRQFYSKLSGSLWNTYGPTEATVQSTFARCAPDDGYVPIGKPIANTTLYVLGPDQQPVPFGLPGELYIGGNGVTRGYWKRPELTATKFVPDPFSNSPGGRLYRTGDTVRYHADGNLEFLGRIDLQIKIRGFRIELEEIEAVLGKHEGVAQAAVITVQDKSSKKLQAFMIARPGQNPSTLELRALVQRELPAYMMPASFVTLERFPLMPNGKLDRKALARHAAQSGSSEIEPPRTPAEELLAAIWSKVLKTGPIGRQENFLHLGGHSLLAMQVVSQIRNLFHVDIPLRSVLEFATIESLAVHIQDQFGKLPRVSGVAPRQGSRAIAPIGIAQQRLWFLQQLEPRSCAYNVPMVLRLIGPVNYGDLESSLAEIIRRHESLRTYFRKSGLDEEPVQVIEPELPFTLSTVDLLSTSSESAMSRAQEMIREEIRRPFHLEQGPLIRALLLRVALDEHVFVLVIHHIICDGWSMRIFARELTALYAAFIENKKLSLPELPVQYADYVLWQREWLREEIVRSQLSYWKRQLGGDTDRLSLPADSPRPEMQTFDSQKVILEAPADVVTRMKELALRQEVTSFMYVSAALMVLLHRYSGEMSIVVGTPIAGRNVPEVEDLIGFFANTLALRCDLGGNPPVRELLGRVREAALGAYAHQDVPFDKVVEELRPERDLSSTPLFQVMLAVENAAGPEWELNGLHISMEEIEGQASKFDLTVNLAIGTALHGAFIYNTNVLEHGVVEGMARHFVRLLQQMTLDVNTRIGDLHLLEGTEYQQVIVEWNRTGMDHPVGCIHHLFEKQAAATPQACAVECNGKRLSYEELNQLSNQLAHCFNRCGIGPEKLVGVCMSRTHEMIITLLAILKAGGAYVPLDSNYPRDRISFILRETQAAVLVTEPEHLDRVSSSSAEILLLPRLWERACSEKTKNPSSPVGPGNLSYLIYTSGSTGEPKGVAVEHRNAVSMLYWARSVFSDQELSGVLASTSICFDLSVFEIFVPLSWGGTVLLVNNVLELPELASRRQVPLVNSVPSLIAELLDNGKMPSCVGTVNLAGEPLSATLVDDLYEQKGVERVFDLYGPSEDTTYSTFVLRGAGTRETIGRPLANKQMYVLDRYQHPVPPKVSGELFIGGEGVARGYFRQPKLTAERFVPDPFSDKPGSRLYRTGDKVRYGADGNLEFQGRLDQQIKIRGFRIELREIQSVLNSHSGVQQALVMAVADDTRGKRLVAYVIADPANPPEVEALRGFAKQKLPEYMVPSFFVLLEKFPLNSNGKIDRKALPKPELKQNSAYQPPRNSLERTVSACWEELLRLDCVGVHDNFFDLGGHSMLLIRLQGRLERALGRSIDVHVLFRHLTVESQASYLAESVNVPQQGPGIERVERVAFLPISFQEELVWTLCQLDSRHLAYNVIRGVRMIGGLDTAALDHAWRKLMERHEILRTGFVLQNKRPSRTIHASLPFELEATDLQEFAPGLRESETIRLATLECNLPFTLAEPPLFRVRLFKLSAQEHVLSIVFHHMIIDAVSLSVLLEELCSFYASYSRQDSLPPEMSLQYADYAAWQRNQLLTRLPEMEQYWTAKLDGLSNQLKLSDGLNTQAGPAAPTFVFQLGRKETKALKFFSSKEKATLFAVLLAVFKLWVHQETGATDIAVGVPVANRGRRELERMVGFFSNLIILRTSLSNRPTFRQLLHRVQETAQESYAYQDMPFQYLIEKLRPEPVHKKGLFQVKFIFISDSDRNLEIPGLLTEAFPIGTEHQAGNELSLYIRDEGSHVSFLVAYKPWLFTKGRIEDFSKKYLGLVAQVMASPRQKIDQFTSEVPAVAEG